MAERSPDPAGPGHGNEMDQGEVLRQLAEDKIMAPGGRRLGPEVNAAARLLADLYTAGLTHGINPQEWDWVADLPDACWHASRDAACRRQRQVERAADGRPASEQGRRR
jgi:hypothetical protein